MNKLSRIAVILAFTAFGSGTAASQAAAAIATPRGNVEYVATIASPNSHAYPYTGLLRLTINNGLITGTYVSTSIIHDPTRGHAQSVTGNINGNRVKLNIGNAMTFSGTVRPRGRTFVGNAVWIGQTYAFEAKKAWPPKASIAVSN
jgi:hypothetical protein